MLFRSHAKLRTRLTRLVAMLVVVQPQMLVAGPVVQAPAASSRVTPRTPDIALQVGGTLAGQIIDANGTPVADEAVRLSNGQQTWQTRTTADGWFHLSDLRGGTYELQAAGQNQLLRTWAPGTAPPRASEGVLISPTADVVRGQRVLSPNTNRFFCVAKQRLTNPWILGGLVTGIVAIPVAIHNAQDDDPAPATP